MTQLTAICRWRLLTRRPVRIPDPALARRRHVARWNLHLLRCRMAGVDDYYALRRTTDARGEHGAAQKHSQSHCRFSSAPVRVQ
jgi:hypothetical protein